MKKEIFRMINVITDSPDFSNLNDMNLHINQGEILGLIPVNGIGIQVFLEMFTSAIPVKFGKIYIGNVPLNPRQPRKQQLNKTYILNQQRKLVDSLSVLENIYVVNSLPFRGIIRKKPLLAQYGWLMEDLPFQIPPDIRCEKLTELERCVIEIHKAVSRDARLIILYGLDDILGAGELARFKNLLTVLSKRNFSFLYICGRHEESVAFCDRIVYMKDGRDIQSFHQEELNSVRYLKFSRSLFSSDAPVNPIHKKPFLIIRHLPSPAYGEFFSDIYQGECFVIYDETKEFQKEFVEAIHFNHGNLKNIFEITDTDTADNLADSIGKQIAVINENPLETMLFWDMSYIDNLCFRMESKIRRINLSKAIKMSIQTEYAPLLGNDIYAGSLSGLSPFSLYSLIYYRVALIRPKAVFIIQPFYNTDIYLKTHIQNLIHMLQERKISVIILSSDLPDSISIANRRLVLENGTIRPDIQGFQ